MKALSLILTILLLTACASKKQVSVIDMSFDIAEEKGKLYASFLKNKGYKFDFGTTATSSSETSLIINKKDITCGKGEAAGMVVKYGDIKGPFIVIPKAKFTKFYIVCKIDTTLAGDYYVNFEKIYNTKDKESILPHEVIAEKQKWILAN